MKERKKTFGRVERTGWRGMAVAWMAVVMVALGGCRGKAPSAEVFLREVYAPGYAKGFDIAGAEGMESTIARVRNPWQGAEGVTQEYFVVRDGERPPRGFQGVTIPGGARRIVCMSSSHVAMLDAFGEVERVVGVSGIDFISNAYVAAHRDTIGDVGAEMNYETLVGLRPDLVLLYGIGDAQSAVTDKLRELGIPYMYIGEYVEESPLGRAEWMVLLGEVTDRREESETAFRAIAERYERLKAETAAPEGRKKVMVNTPWQDTWYMPSTRSVIARLIEDAGGDYIYKENETNGSLPVGMETAYRLLREADVWIETGQCASLADLLAVNPRFAEAKAVKTGQVYNNNRRTTPGGGNDYWESAVVRPDVVLCDLIRILHPEDGEGELYYYRQLK